MSHKHNFQFVCHEVHWTTKDGNVENDQVSLYFACECGKMKMVKSKR